MKEHRIKRSFWARAWGWLTRRKPDVLLIREQEDSDDAALEVFVRAQVGEPPEWSLLWLKASTYRIPQLREGNVSLVAFVDGALVGQVGLIQFNCGDDVPPKTHLGIAVARSWQGSNIGHLLMTEVFAWARKAPKVDKVWSSIESKNEASRKLHLRNGFVIEAEDTDREVLLLSRSAKA